MDNVTTDTEPLDRAYRHLVTTLVDFDTLETGGFRDDELARLVRAGVLAALEAVRDGGERLGVPIRTV